MDDIFWVMISPYLATGLQTYHRPRTWWYRPEVGQSTQKALGSCHHMYVAEHERKGRTRIDNIYILFYFRPS